MITAYSSIAPIDLSDLVPMHPVGRARELRIDFAHEHRPAGALPSDDYDVIKEKVMRLVSKDAFRELSRVRVHKVTACRRCNETKAATVRFEFLQGATADQVRFEFWSTTASDSRIEEIVCAAVRRGLRR